MKTRDKLVLIGSFLVTSALGGAFVAWHWSGMNLPVTAATRSGGFVAVMALVHWVAFRVYQFQPGSVSLLSNSTTSVVSQTSSPPTTSSLFLPLASEYRPAVTSAVIQQLIFVVLGALTLDGGYLGQACCVTAIAHWSVILLIVLRRPFLPTKVDLIVIRNAFLLLLLFVLCLAPFIQEWMLTRVLRMALGSH